MSGKTIVNTEIGGQFNKTLPAITLCIPELYSMERFAKIIPGVFSELNKNYQELLKTDGLGKALKLYQKYFGNSGMYAGLILKRVGLDMNVLFDNMSIKFKALDGNPLMRLSLYGKTDINYKHGDFNPIPKKTNQEYRYVGEPLETIVIK